MAVSASGLRSLASGEKDGFEVARGELTLTATVFLPLTFITGFFGQNFAWTVALYGWFKRGGYVQR